MPSQRKKGKAMIGGYVPKELADAFKAAAQAREMCECHVARPTRYGFPTVQLDDFCSCHVDAQTFERTFAPSAFPSI